MPGEYTLYKGLSFLHKATSYGVLWEDTPPLNDYGMTSYKKMEDGFSRIWEDGGPGFPIATYLPKKEKDLEKKFKASLEPSEASNAAVAASIPASKGDRGAGKGDGKGVGKSHHSCIKIREKRLDVALWTCNGVN